MPEILKRLPASCGKFFAQLSPAALDGLKALLDDAITRMMDVIDAHIECLFLQVLQLDARTLRLEALEINNEQRLSRLKRTPKL
jgi:hypothetical protein